MSARPPGPTYRLPMWLLATLVVIVLGLVGGIILVSHETVVTDRRLAALEEYVSGKGQQRDAENDQLNRRITAAICGVLDQLPAGGQLDVIRQSEGCGPGLPQQHPSTP